MHAHADVHQACARNVTNTFIQYYPVEEAAFTHNCEYTKYSIESHNFMQTLAVLQSPPLKQKLDFE